MLKKYGLTCAIASSHGFVKGWNHKENWDFCADNLTTNINAAADSGTKAPVRFIEVFPSDALAFPAATAAAHAELAR